MPSSPGSVPLGRRYRTVFTASTISNLGDGVFEIALPLAAAELTRDPTAIALVTLAERLPWLFFSLVAGALVDRWDRRTVMWRADTVRAVMVGVLAVAVATDSASLVMLYVVALGLGVAETLFDNASQTILPSIVDRSNLERANGRLYAAETITNQFVGPPLGGFLVAAAAWVAFGLDAVSFVVAAALVASLPGSYRPAGDAPPRQRLRTEIGEGLRWLWGNRLLRTLGLLLGLLNLWSTAFFAVLVLFAQDVLGLGAIGFGLLGTAGAVGSVLGGLTGSRLSARLGRRTLLIGSAAVMGVAQLAAGLVSDPWSFGALLAVMGFAGVAWNVVTVSLRQTLIPDHLLGRVNSVYRFLGWGSMPVGALLGGVLADAISLRAPFWVGGVVILLGVALAVPVLARADELSADLVEGDEAPAVEHDGLPGDP